MTIPVVGPRSPRWAFLKKMVIPCQGGEVYLVRYRLIDTPWFGVYLHDIQEPDHDYDPHDHPWNFISVILRGGYIEKVWPMPWVHLGAGSYRRRWLRWSWLAMDTCLAHRIEEVQPGTWSLILRGKRTRVWGFHTQGGFVPWMEYKAK
jgi:hypothetical protein